MKHKRGGLWEAIGGAGDMPEVGVLDKNRANPNDLIPAFNIFTIIIIVTITLKIVFQYLYSEPTPQENGEHDLTNLSLIQDSSNAAKSQQGGYFKSYQLLYLTIGATLVLLVSVLAITFAKYDDQRGDCTMKMTMFNTVPILLFLGILIWVVVQNTVYSDKINSGHVANMYIVLDTGVSILLFIQALIIYGFISEQTACPNTTPSTKKNEAIAKYGPYLSTVLAVIGYVCMTFNEIILGAFSTDG